MELLSTILKYAAGVTSTLSLLAFLGGLYAWIHSQIKERSVVEAIKGEGIVRAGEVVDIMKQFKDDDKRLKALKALLKYSDARARDVLDKVKPNVDVGKFSLTQQVQIQRQLVIAGVVLIIFAGLSFAISRFQGKTSDVKPEVQKDKVTQTPPSRTWHTEDKDGRPYEAHWQFPANCRGAYGLIRVDDSHRCDIEPTQIDVNNDPTKYDTWNLWMDAPEGAVVYDVGCEPTGDHEIRPQGLPQGQTGLCTGLINGGRADIRMSIKWKQLW